MRSFVFCSAAANRPGPGHHGAVVRPGSDAGQLRFRVAAAVRAVELDGAGPRHGARHETVPLHGRPVPGTGEPVRGERGRAGARRFRARQPDAPPPDAPAHRRGEAGQGHGDDGRAAAQGPVRPGGRGRDRVRCAGDVVRRRRRQRSAGGRRRIHGRQFYGNVLYYNIILCALFKTVKNYLVVVGIGTDVVFYYYTPLAVVFRSHS